MELCRQPGMISDKHNNKSDNCCGIKVARSNKNIRKIIKNLQHVTVQKQFNTNIIPYILHASQHKECHTIIINI